MHYRIIGSAEIRSASMQVEQS